MGLLLATVFLLLGPGVVLAQRGPAPAAETTATPAVVPTATETPGPKPEIRKPRTAAAKNRRRRGKKVEPKGKAGKVEPKEKTGKVEPKGKAGKVEPKEKTGKVEPKEKTGKAEPKGKAGQPGGKAALKGIKEKPAPKKSGKSGGRGKKLYKVDFDKQGIEDIIKIFSKHLNRNFLIDQKARLQAKVTFISPREVTYGELERVFESILHAHNLTLVPGPNRAYFKIVQEKEAISDTLPLYTTPSRTAGRRSDLFITRLIPLEHVDAKELESIVKKFSSRQGDVTAYERTNVLIVTESSANINRILRLLESLDVPDEEEVIEVVEIVNATADVVANQIQSIFGGKGGKSKSIAKRGKGKSRRGGAGGGADFRVVIDDRTNRLFIIGKESKVRQIKEFIPLLDVRAPGVTGENIYVYYLQYAEAKEIASTLSNLTKAGVKQNKKGRKKGQPPLPSRVRQAAKPSATGPITAQFESGVRITADETLNALVIIASLRDYENLKKVIRKLDIRRRQVYVEAAVVQMGVSSSWSLGIAGGGGATKSGAILFGQSNVGGLSPYAGAVGGAGASAAGATGSSAGALGSLAGLGGFSAGVLGKELEIAGFKIPTYAAVMNAVRADSDSNVLSTPTIMTTDNEEAKIVIGQNIPIPTGQTVGTSGVTTSTISRQNVGITMQITPQISEGDTVRLKISFEVSNVSREDLGIDVNSTGIVTTERTANTTVLVEDHQPVIIGGLMEDRQSVTATKVPILGDIPILGWLFKKQSSESRKQNLVIYITPHIVRTRADAAAISLSELKEHSDDIDEKEFVRCIWEAIPIDEDLPPDNEPMSIERIRLKMPPGSVLITPDGQEIRPPGGEGSKAVPEDDAVPPTGESDADTPGWIEEKRIRDRENRAPPPAVVPDRPSATPKFDESIRGIEGIDKLPPEALENVERLKNEFLKLKESMSPTSAPEERE